MHIISYFYTTEIQPWKIKPVAIVFYVSLHTGVNMPLLPRKAALYHIHSPDQHIQGSLTLTTNSVCVWCMLSAANDVRQMTQPVCVTRYICHYKATGLKLLQNRTKRGGSDWNCGFTMLNRSWECLTICDSITWMLVKQHLSLSMFLRVYISLSLLWLLCRNAVVQRLLYHAMNFLHR